MHNIIFIICDTFRQDHLGCYGHSSISTPNLDNLAKKSVIFDRAYMASFPSLPNRYDIFKGQYSYTYTDWGNLPKYGDTLSTLLRKAGYKAALFSENFFIKNFFRFYSYRNFDEWKLIDRGKPRKKTLESDYELAETILEAVKWLQSNSEEKFFLYIDISEPHEFWDPPRRYIRKYGGKYVGPIPPSYPYTDKKSELRNLRIYYAATISFVDKWIGIFLDSLKDLGLMKNSIIVFTSDHGTLLGEHNKTGKNIGREEKKGDTRGWFPLYEELAHIPLIIKAPACKESRSSALAQPPDFMPTLLELAGIECPNDVHGKSLVPILKGKKATFRDFAVSSPTLIHGNAGGVRTTITTDEWSFIYAGSSNMHQKKGEIDGLGAKLKVLDKPVKHELYHLLSDPNQENDLFEEKREIAKKLQGRYTKFLKNLKIKKRLLKYWRSL